MLRLTPNSPSGKTYEIVSYLYLGWNQLTRQVLIDFGLSSQAQYAENYAVDLYVLERAFASTHPASEGLYAGVRAIINECFRQKLMIRCWKLMLPDWGRRSGHLLNLN